MARLKVCHGLLTSVADFADAAYEANKRNQVLLASQLMDVDWIALRLSRDIATAALPYAQGVIYGIAYGATDVLHMASRPIETCKDLGKTICFALETAALNCVEDESMAPESYKLKRDQRNEQVAQALHKLGDQMANSTGPQRVEALARFGANYYFVKLAHSCSRGLFLC
ncbi:MAG: hypothetical protein NTU89_00980 [Candidatus Dependentiae bacterium]|nr:hypothetical protein [Candidatus Dependentiae bacterium]